MISIVTPNYNCERWLNECLSSVAAQTLKQEEIEMVIIDDGSTDNSRNIIEGYKESIPGLKTIWNEHTGHPGVLRNIGIRKAIGEYVLFLDSDDFLGEKSLERLDKFTKNTPSDLVAFQLDGLDRKVPRSMLKKTIEHADLVDTGLYKTLGTWKMCRRDFINEVGIHFGELNRGEDVIFFTEAMLRAKSVSIISGYPFYTVRGREDGTSITQKEWANIERIKLARKMAETVLKWAPEVYIANHFLVRAFNTDAMSVLNNPHTTENDRMYLKDMLGNLWNDDIKVLIYTDDNRDVLVDFFEKGV